MSSEKPKSGRRADRLQHELLVAYRTVDGFITDWAVNISRGGIFINTRNPLPVGHHGADHLRSRALPFPSS